MNWHVTANIKKRFEAVFEDAFRLNQPLAKYTSARVGGSAEMLLTVRSAEELQTAVELAYTLDVPYFILGGGSNILIADQGISGLTIHNRAKNVTFRNTGVGIRCRAESGANLSMLTRTCIGKGFGGLEWAIGVPGTVGGAVVNNAGAHGADMATNLITATVWEPGLGARIYELEELEYEYRNSTLKREHQSGEAMRVVLSADLDLKPEPVRLLQARADAFNSHRKESQPGGATMGSMFKNPEHFYAGYLIDAAGLKGMRIGGVRVSEKHANFFICDDYASAEDIREMIAEVWHVVRKQFGVELEPEVELIGDWQFEEAEEEMSSDE